MRLPKRIADIIKRKDDFITAREASLNKSVVRLQNMLISKLTREIIPALNSMVRVALHSGYSGR